MIRNTKKLVFALAIWVMLAGSAMAYTVCPPANSTVIPGQQISVAIAIDNPSGLEAFGFDIIFPNSMLTYVDADSNPAITGAPTFFGANLVNSNTIRLAWLFSGGPITNSLSGPIAYVKFNVAPAATGLDTIKTANFVDLAGAVTCTGIIVAPAPEVNIKQNGLTIADDSGNLGFGTTTVGATIDKTFKVYNTGTANLTLSGLAAPTGFGIQQNFGSATVAPGDSTTFIIRLLATAAGVSSGSLSFANNDSDENPYNFTISGTVNLPAAPEITIKQNGATIADDGTFSFGTTIIGTPVDKIFKVYNTGSDSLKMTSAITVPTGFSVPGSFGKLAVAPGDSTTFTIRLSATEQGGYSGALSFANNDSDENPYNFTISGTVNTSASILWQLPITVKSGSFTATRTFGAAVGATDEFDNGLDAPFPPPSFGRNVYFSVTGIFTNLSTDLRNSAQNNHTWLLRIANTGGTADTLQWSTASLSGVSGALFMADSINMRTQSMAVFSGDVDITIALRDTLLPPSLVSPANGYAFNSTPSLDWSDVGGATHYILQVDTTSTFAAPILVDSSLTLSQRSLSALSSDVYYWRVRAKDATRYSVWSATRSFEVNTTAPANWTFPFLEVWNKTKNTRIDLSFGIDLNGEDAFEALDIAAPPASPSEFYASFQIGGLPNQLSRDIRDAAKDTVRWTLKLQNSGGADRDSIRWNLGYFPPQARLFLSDGSTRATINMAVQSYAIFTGNPTLTLTYIFTPGALPIQVTGLNATPGTFSPDSTGNNDSTLVSYTLNKNAAVTMVVVSSIGDTLWSAFGWDGVGFHAPHALVKLTGAQITEWDGAINNTNFFGHATYDNNNNHIADKGTYTYYITARDTAANAVVPSQTVSGTVTIGSVVPNLPSNPGITNGATGVSRTPTLSWTGGDPDLGEAVTYTVYFGTSGTPTTVVSTNQTGTTYAPGTLNYGTNYFWRILTGDNFGNTRLGPIWSFTTLAAPTDTLAPARITNLQVISTLFNSIKLAWTAVGDDSLTGQATSYQLRYSTSPINNGNFGSATLITTGTPRAAGQADTASVSGLSRNTTYYFAIKAADEVGNLSLLSNVVTQATLTVTNIALRKPTQASAQLNLAENAVDGFDNTDWNAGVGTLPQELTISFQGKAHVDSIALRSNQDTPGTSTHNIRFINSSGASTLTHTFSQNITSQGQWLTHKFSPFYTDVTRMTVQTTASPVFPSWFEIQVFGFIYEIGDTIAPRAITNLAVSTADSTKIILTWTATGDDTTFGRATEYDLRYNTVPITINNFYTSSRYIIPAPKTSGTSELDTLRGLTACQTYYFAIRAHDEVPNISGMSNVIPASPCPFSDFIPPAAVTNLAVTGTTHNTATLQWTAPGDDGNSGQAIAYDLRYSLTPITHDSLFNKATPAGPQPVPIGPLNTQTFTVSGLSPLTTYYFAIKTADEVPNWSPRSNTAQGTTTEPPDTKRPAPICNLVIFEVTLSSVKLAWQAVGDDSLTGSATSYDIRYSLSPITEGNFNAATQWTPSPTAQPAGTWLFATVTGLQDSVNYYFAVKARDDLGQISTFCAAGMATAYTQNTRGMVLESTADDIESVYLSGPGFSGVHLWTNSSQAERTAMTLSLIPDSSYVLCMRVSDLGGPSGAHLTSLFDTNTGEVVFNSTDDGNWKYSFTFPGDNWQRRDYNDASWLIETKMADYGESYPPVGGWLDQSADWIWGIPFEHFDLWIRRKFTITTVSGDNRAPSKITDLAAVPLSNTQVRLDWTSPGDNDRYGKASQYDLRYSTSALSEGNFNSATAVSGEPAPDWAGIEQSHLVSGLVSNTTYYFAIKSLDDAGLWSPISNVAIALTNLPPDTTKPNAVTDLAMADTSAFSLTLKWTAPRDTTIFGATAAVAAYDIYYADFALTSGNYQTGTRVSGPLTPLAPGQLQTFEVSGLRPNANYWLALRSRDAAGNSSLISNIVQGKTDREFLRDNLCLNKPTIASSNSNQAFRATDGDGFSQWDAAAFFPQWIEVDLQGLATVDSLAFKAAISLSGQTIHEVHFIRFDESDTLAHVFSGFTSDGLWLTHKFETPIAGVTKIRVETVLSISTVAWYELQAFGPIRAGDDTPPGAITDLQVIAANNTFVTLSWPAPGDDNQTGVASYYDVRYATFPITADNFASATPAINEPAPDTTGSIEAFTVDGLTANTVYYFAVKTGDELFNWSPISNIATAVTDAVFRGTIVGTDICSNTTWTTSGSPYIVVENIVICSGTTLTINAGVQVRFGNNRKIIVQSNAAIRATGTAPSPIVMESGGVWQGIVFNGFPATSNFNFVQFRNLNTAAIQLLGGDNLTIQNCTFENITGGCAIYLENASPTITSNTLRAAICSSDGRSNPTITGNTFSGGSGQYPITVGAMSVMTNSGSPNVNTNTITSWSGGIAIRLWATDITRNTTWPNTVSLPYYVQGDINIYNNATLTISAGAVARFADDAQLTVGKVSTSSVGGLSAVGTSGQRIVLRGDLLNSSVRWDGIVFTPFTLASRLVFCQISEADQTYPGSLHTTISVNNTQNVTITDNTITGGTGIHAILLDDASLVIERNTVGSIYVTESTTIPTIRNNAFSGSGLYPISMGAMGNLFNNSFAGWSGAAGICLWSTEITQNSRWTNPWFNSAPLPYKIKGDIFVVNDANLTIDDSVKVHFVTGSTLQVGDPDFDEEGRLQVNGLATTAGEVLLACDPGNPNLTWAGVHFTSEVADSSWLKNVRVEQAFGFYDAENSYSVFVDETEVVHFDNVDVVAPTGVNAILLNATSLRIENGEVTGPIRALESTGAPTIRNTAFRGTGVTPLIMGAMTHLINNTFTGWTSGQYIQVLGTTIVDNVTWPRVTQFPYYVTGSLFVGDGATFGIDAGVNAIWADDMGLFTGDRTTMTAGRLDVNGTAALPVHFWAKDTDLTESWRGLYFTEYTDSSFVDYLTLDDARTPVTNIAYTAVRAFGTNKVFMNNCQINGDDATYPIYLEDASLILSNNTIRSSVPYAIYATSGTSNPSLTGNIFIGAGDYPFQVGAMSTIGSNDYTQWIGEKGIKFLATTITRATTWPIPPNNLGQYHIFGEIDTQARLTIQPGVMAKFNQGAALKASRDGSIWAVGQPTDTGFITFTGIEGNIGTWSGIQFEDSADTSRIAYALVQYAGDTYPFAGIFIQSPKITVDHCNIVRVYGSGIYSQIVNPTLHSNILANNSGYGINHISGLTPRVTHNDAYHNNAGDYHGLPDPTGGGTSISTDPLFVDFARNDWHLLPGSPCRGTGKDGTSMGIFQYADNVPPSRIHTLRVVGAHAFSVELAWAAPGDDSIFGRAAQYDLRYSTVPISAENFGSATRFNLPAPTGAGLGEFHEVTGLTQNTLYFFAVKAIDDRGNVSAMSNVVSAFTEATGDIFPPDAVAGLTIIDVTFNSVTLQWLSPGDDAAIGQASLYDLRYSTGTITAANFSQATNASGEPLPEVAGSLQTFTVFGLNPSTHYYFALRTRDEANWSGLSNVVDATTDPFQPRILVNPGSYDFGGTMIGVAKVWEMQIINDGALPLNIAGIVSDDADFTVANSAFTLNPGERRIQPVTFLPQALGFDDALISITTNDPDNLNLRVRVTGTGVLPTEPILSAPTVVDFGVVNLNQSKTLTIRVRNEGGTLLRIASATSDLAPFVLSPLPRFPKILASLVDTVLTVTFTPTVYGTHEGHLELVSNDPDNAGVTVITLRGFGYAAVPVLQQSGQPHDFGTIQVGQTRDWSFEIWNHAGANTNLSVTVSSTGSMFQIVRPTGSTSSLAPGQRLAVTVRFAPTAAGNFTGNFRIQSNDPQNALVNIAMLGQATPIPVPDMSVAATSVAFGDVYQNASAQRTLLVTNTGSAQLQINALTFANPQVTAFTVVAPAQLPLTVDPGQQTGIILQFNPTAITSYANTLQIVSNDPPTISVSLTGRGIVVPAPELNVPAPLVFPFSHNYGAVARPTEWSFLIENIVSSPTTPIGPLSINNIVSNNSAFVVTHPTVFPQIIPAGENMQIYVTFYPATVTPVSGTITITTNDPDEGTVSVQLTGSKASAIAQYSAGDFDFGSMNLGQSASRSLRVTNNGNVNLNIFSIDLISDQFAVSGVTLPLNVAPGGSANLSLTYTAVHEGEAAATLVIHSNADNIPDQTVTLRGRGTSPEILVDVFNYDFGPVTIGEAPTWPLVVRNTGSGPLTIQSAQANNAAFTVTGQIGPINPGATATYTVKFTPTARQNYTAVLTVRSDDADEPVVTVNLFGMGAAPVVNINEVVRNFGPVRVGRNSDSWLVSVQNLGDAALVLSNPVFSDTSAFRFANNAQFPLSINSLETVTLPIRFTPKLRQQYTGTLIVRTNDAARPTLTLNMSGRGLAPVIAANPTTQNFGNADVNQRIERLITLSNTGDATLTITDMTADKPDIFGVEWISAVVAGKSPQINLTGLQDLSGFAQPDSIAPGQTKQIRVSFRPQAATAYTGQLTIRSDAFNAAAYTIGLSGIGVSPEIQLSASVATFGDVRVMQNSVRNFSIFNLGNGSLTISAITSSMDSIFTISGLTFPAVIPGNDTLDFRIVFAPRGPRSYTAEISIASNDTDEPLVKIFVGGAGIQPDILLPQTSHNFGAVDQSTNWEMEIRNIGRAPLQVLEVTRHSDRIRITNIPRTPIITDGNAFVTVTFTPIETDTLIIDTLQVRSDDPDNPVVNVVVRGSHKKVSVELLSFTATAKPGLIELEWLVSEASTPIGFHVYRTEAGVLTDRQKVNETMLLANGLAYRFKDQTVRPEATYLYWLEGLDANGSVFEFGPLQQSAAAVPTALRLWQNYPNPFQFGGLTTIRLELPRAQTVSLKVYNIDGRFVKTLLNAGLETGYHTILWDGTNEAGRPVAGGTYLYQLESGGERQTLKMTLMR